MTILSPRRSLVLALASTILCATADASAASTLSANQAKTYFASARLVAQGSMDGAQETAAVVANANSSTSRLEIWRETDKGFELIASAPRAGCTDCSGPNHKPNPSSITFSHGVLEVEYEGGGTGVGYWAWRSSWSWDPVLSSVRALSTQRIGSDEQGEARLAMVNFVDGSRTTRLRDEAATLSASCRAAIARAPSFSMLSLPALFDGTLEPECQNGSETGDPLAASPTPSSGALDNMMRSSIPRRH